MAQRGIPARVVSALVATGKREHDGRGGLRIHLHHKEAQRRFGDYVGKCTSNNYRNVHAILADESNEMQPTLVTVGWLSGKQRAR